MPFCFGQDTAHDAIKICSMIFFKQDNVGLTLSGVVLFHRSTYQVLVSSWPFLFLNSPFRKSLELADGTAAK